MGHPPFGTGLYYADNHDQCRYEQQGGSHWRVSAMLIITLSIRPEDTILYVFARIFETFMESLLRFW